MPRAGKVTTVAATTLVVPLYHVDPAAMACQSWTSGYYEESHVLGGAKWVRF
jgi:hypothetical protein